MAVATRVASGRGHDEQAIAKSVGVDDSRQIVGQDADPREPPGHGKNRPGARNPGKQDPGRHRHGRHRQGKNGLDARGRDDGVHSPPRWCGAASDRN